MITQGIDARTGETVGLDAAGTKARSAQADAPAKSLNSPTTTQGEALEARAYHGEYRDAVEFALHHHDDTLETYEFLKAWNEGALDEWPEFYEWLDARTAALQPNIDHAVGGVREQIARIIDPAAWRDQGYLWAKWRIDQSLVKADTVLAALSAPQQPVKLDAVR